MLNAMKQTITQSSLSGARGDACLQARPATRSRAARQRALIKTADAAGNGTVMVVFAELNV